MDVGAGHSPFLTGALARARAAYHDAKQARWTLRDDYADARRPGRFSRLRATVVRLQAAHGRGRPSGPTPDTGQQQ